MVNRNRDLISSDWYYFNSQAVFPMTDDLKDFILSSKMYVNQLFFPSVTPFNFHYLGPVAQN